MVNIFLKYGTRDVGMAVDGFSAYLGKTPAFFDKLLTNQVFRFDPLKEILSRDYRNVSSQSKTKI